MATTTNYGWTLPTVGDDSGAWGTILNTLIQAIDTALKAVSTVANAALSKAGGVMTGRVDALTSTMALVAKGTVSGATALDVATGQYFTATISGATTFSFSNVPSGTWATAVLIRLTNAGSSVTWPATVKWPSGTAPTLTTSGVDLVALITDDSGTTWRGIVAGRDLR